MTKINLKNIVGRRSQVSADIVALMRELGEEIWIEDESGKVLLGNPIEGSSPSFPITLDSETLGFVKGSGHGGTIANLISHLALKEAEKKKN